MPRPTPLVAPVTTATLPFRFIPVIVLDPRGPDILEKWPGRQPCEGLGGPHVIITPPQSQLLPSPLAQIVVKPVLSLSELPPVILIDRPGDILIE
jgi:hypothetical protein